jgi:hypothetical protein
MRRGDVDHVCQRPQLAGDLWVVSDCHVTAAVGAGFCYNIGRILSAAGVVLFGIFNKVQGDSPGSC